MVKHSAKCFGCEQHVVWSDLHSSHEWEHTVALGHGADTHLQWVGGARVCSLVVWFTASGRKLTSLSERACTTRTQDLGMALFLHFMQANIRGMWPSGGT